MDLHHHPDLLQRLAAAYALGTLRGGARRRFETLARRSATVRAAALLWQERFAAMTEIQPQETPSANVWKRIANEIAAQRVPVARADTPAASPRAGWWRVGAFAASAAAVAAISASVVLLGDAREREAVLAQSQRTRMTLASQNAALSARLQAQPEVRYVAVLLDQKSAESLLVTFDAGHNALMVKRVGGFQPPSDKSLQLWALPPGSAPRSLGVLGDGDVDRIAAARDQIQSVPLLAVSMEPRGGVPGEGGPTGPVLFKGALLQTP